MTLSELASTALPLVTFGYVLLCVASPFGSCRKCRGLGFQARYDRKGRVRRGKDCRRCGTTGLRLRIGRRLYNLWARIHRDGTR